MGLLDKIDKVSGRSIIEELPQTRRR